MDTKVFEMTKVFESGLKVGGNVGISDQVASLILQILQYNFPEFFAKFQAENLVYGTLVMLTSASIACIANWLKNRNLGNAGQSLQK